MIQRLIKSNPTPAYVARVSRIFNNDGKNVRGNMAAVIKAILLDPEARDCHWPHVYGLHDLEPDDFRHVQGVGCGWQDHRKHHKRYFKPYGYE